MKYDLIKRSAAVLVAAALVTGYTPLGSAAGVSQAVSVMASADSTNDNTSPTTWSELQSMINNAANGDVITLDSNGSFTASSSD